MANLGDFFELVFAAKVYQRFNPENYSNLKIVNKNINENFNNESLSVTNTVLFLRNNKNLINNNKIKSSSKIYFNENYQDIVRCSLYFNSNIDDVQQFIKNYTVKTNIQKDILNTIIDKLQREHKNIPTYFLQLKKQYNNIEQLTNIIEKTKGFKEYVENHSKQRIKKIYNILNFDVMDVKEINELLKIRNIFILNEKQENLNFVIVMEGKTRIDGKQAKTDIKIELAVDWIENNKKNNKIFTRLISLKYDVPKIETASLKTFETIQQYFNSENILIKEKGKELKQSIINFIFDDLEKTSESLVKLNQTSKNNLKRLSKLKLKLILNELDENKFKRTYTKDNLGKISLLTITYNNENFLIFRKRENKNKLEYEVYLGNYLITLMK